MTSIIQVYFDASPEKMAVIIDEKKHVEVQCINSVDPVRLEYAALLYALSKVEEDSSIELHSDNQTIVAQLHSRHYDPCNENNESCSKVKELLKRKKLSYDIFWIPRKYNSADKLL